MSWIFMTDASRLFQYIGKSFSPNIRKHTCDVNVMNGQWFLSRIVGRRDWYYFCHHHPLIWVGVSFRSPNHANEDYIYSVAEYTSNKVLNNGINLIILFSKVGTSFDSSLFWSLWSQGQLTVGWIGLFFCGSYMLGLH